MSSNPLTVRIKVTTVDKSLAQFLSYKVYFWGKKSYSDKFDSNGCSKVYNATKTDIVWFEVILKGVVVDKIFLIPTTNGKYSDNSYILKVLLGKPTLEPVNKPTIMRTWDKLLAAKLKTIPQKPLPKVSFCQALDLFIKNPSEWTADNPRDLESDDIGGEVDYVKSLGINNNTTDGVDLHYFLVQYRYKRTVDATTGFLAWGAMTGYIIGFSGYSAIRDGVSWEGYVKDVKGDMTGNNAGLKSAFVGLKHYYSVVCKK